jgi:hypothetical protein
MRSGAKRLGNAKLLAPIGEASADARAEMKGCEETGAHTGLPLILATTDKPELIHTL